ncbi:MAG TPA: 4Fe-4S binding protein [Anaerolineae bacterium]|nr:4Fe-4S binding protein [Anaerolineae bacterium]
MAEEQTTGAVGPAEEQPALRRGRRGRVRVFGNWCKGCGLCIAFCPRDVFVAGADGHPIVVNPERCTACMWCAEHCPDFAIEVGLEDESTERRDAA